MPPAWELVPPGDAALTRRVKAAGEFWLVQEKVGRKVFSRGARAPRDTIAAIRQELAAERATAGHARRREAESRRREGRQAGYLDDFQAAVATFLAFHPRHADVGLAESGCGSSSRAANGGGNTVRR